MAKKSVVVSKQKREQVKQEKIAKAVEKETPPNANTIGRSFVNVVQQVDETAIVEKVRTPEELNEEYLLEIDKLKKELERVQKENAKAFEIITRQRKEINSLKGMSTVDLETEKSENNFEKDAEHSMKGIKTYKVKFKAITDTDGCYYMDHVGNNQYHARD
jgi:hypothetical protein